MSKKLYLLISFVLVLSLVGIATAQSPGDLELWAEYLFEPGDPCADTSGNGYDISPGDVMTGVTLGVYEGFESEGAYHGDIGPYDANTDSHPNIPYILLPPEAWPGGSASGNVTFEMMLYLDEEWALTPTGPMGSPYCGEPASRDLLDIHGHREEDWWSWFDQIPIYVTGSDIGEFVFQWEHGEVNDVNSAYFIDADFWHGGLDYAGYGQRVHVEKETWIHFVVSIDDDHGIIRQWVDARPGGCPGGCAFPEPECASGTYSPGDFTGDASELYLGGLDDSPVRGRIDWVRFYKGYTETALPLPGKVRVSNESPVNAEGHARPDTNLCFQAPVQALCIDPNADPNLKGDFVYDVWFGTDPCSMVLIVDACQPANCNDVMCFDPCDGDLSVATRYYWRVDINDLNEPGDPCFYEGPLFGFRTWGLAENVTPAHGTVGTSPPVLLEWTADGYATSVDIYFGTDQAVVRDANTNNTAGLLYFASQAASDVNYDVGMIDLGRTFYWRIDEVNGVTIPADEVWTFRTGNYYDVETFDSYVLTEPDLTAVWDDYWVNDTGAEIVIVTDANFVCDGHSISFDYDNTIKAGGKYVGSRIDADIVDLPIGPDWTTSGVKALVLYFYGDPLNSATINDRMYVELEDTSSNAGVSIYDRDDPSGDPNNVKLAQWTEWNIDMAIFDACGVSLSNIDKIHIGFGDYYRTHQTAAGGTGTVYLDDIGIYARRCVPVVSYPLGDISADCNVNLYDVQAMAADWVDSDYEVPPEEPCDANLVVHYTYDSDYGDSSGHSYHGEASPSGSTVSGGALHLDGVGYVDVGGDFNSLWLFDGSKDFSIAMSFKTEVQSMLLSMSRPDPCDPDTYDHGTSIYVTHFGGKARPEASVYYDVWAVGWTWSDEYPALDNEWHTMVITYDADSATCPPDAWMCTPGTVTGLATVYLDGYPPTDEEYEGSIWSGHFDPNVPDAYRDTIRIGSIRNPDLATSVFNESGTGFFIGDINSVHIYDSALNHSNVMWLAGASGATYFPNTSTANLVPKTPDDQTYDANNPDIINLLDYAFLADHWLEGPILWP